MPASFLALPLAAALHYITGTGFYVSPDGHAVTNAHVVQNCREIALNGVAAQLLKRDEKADLALLQATGKTAPAVAELRSGYFPPQPGERLVTVGFPHNRLTTREAILIADSGPTGQKEWLRFSDSVSEGNSGGPLLDAGGNVLGVVMAKSELLRPNPDRSEDEVVAESDIAINGGTLRGFLDDNRVRYRESNATGQLAAHRVTDRSKGFVAQVTCLQ